MKIILLWSAGLVIAFQSSIAFAADPVASETHWRTGFNAGISYLAVDDGDFSPMIGLSLAHRLADSLDFGIGISQTELSSGVVSNGTGTGTPFARTDRVTDTKLVNLTAGLTAWLSEAIYINGSFVYAVYKERSSLKPEDLATLVPKPRTSDKGGALTLGIMHRVTPQFGIGPSISAIYHGGPSAAKSGLGIFTLGWNASWSF